MFCVSFSEWSFLDKSLCTLFLHRMCPLQTSSSLNQVPQSLNVPQCSLAESSSPVQYHAPIHSQWHSAAMQLGSQPVTEMLNISWQSLSESALFHGWHLGHTSCGCILVCLIAVWAGQVLNVLWVCPATVGTTLGTNFCDEFSLLLARSA